MGIGHWVRFLLAFHQEELSKRRSSCQLSEATVVILIFLLLMNLNNCFWFVYFSWKVLIVSMKASDIPMGCLSAKCWS